MNISIFSLGQLQANCYFLIQNNECLIIDPADEASFILEELQRIKLKLVGMLATHGHFDHVMAVGEIQISVETGHAPSLPLYIHKNDQFLIKHINETAKYFLGYDPHALQPKTIKYLKAGTFNVSSFTFHVLLTPGHTPGSCCFYFPDQKIIFTGDTLFKQGIGRYDFSYSNKGELKKSLEKLLEVPKDTIVYPGHGEKTTVSEEKDFVRNII